MCWLFFCVPLVVGHMDWLLVDNTSIGEKIDRQINLAFAFLPENGSQSEENAHPHGVGKD